ncbi:MAG: hypothetical protein HY721_12060 [Planctomycetes bacterium]|nr:hypothetical protein [Planctomycetota bacterium]
MTARWLLACVLLLQVAPAPAPQQAQQPQQQPPPPPDGGRLRFSALDVIVDAGAAQLAAYQVEVVAGLPEAKLVGVEGGEARAYAQAPYYDPAALQGGRVIVAAFTTDPDAPSGRTRVARLHFQESAAAELEAAEYSVKLLAAAAPGGAPIEAQVSIQRTATGGQR